MKKSSDGVIVWKYIVCTRDGFKNVVCMDSSSAAELDGVECSVRKRRRVSNRVGCRARIAFRYASNGTYCIHLFEERHNHSLSSLLSRQFLKGNRKLGVGHMKFVADCVKANIGPVQSFRLFKEMVGSFSNVGATSVEFRNIKRDINSYCSSVDAQMVVTNFLKKKEVCPAIFFTFDVDEFDQYQTNMYDMVFTPFTGVNNHKKCITFGAGLLTKEDIESYVWLFEKSKEATGCEPTLFVTDQDPAMRVAFPRDKVGPSLSRNESFRAKLNSVVWNQMLEPTEFDYQWNLVMEEFGLVEHNWFVKLFDIRQFWIPAYFREVFLNALIRTTSRSESENSTPDLKTPLAMEKHAAYVYTVAIFYEVQSEICAACFTCRVVNVREDQGFLYYEIKDGDNRVFSVVHNVVEVIASCGCKMFQRLGLLCRHIFVVFKDLKLDSIPLRYVVKRWTRDASLGRSFDIDGVVVDQWEGVDEKLVLLKSVCLDIQCCISIVQSDMDRLQMFSQIIKEHKDMFLSDPSCCSSVVGKRSIIEEICGSSVPSEVYVLLPKKAKNKGSGKRIKGFKEIAIEESKKEMTCKTCNKPGHDSRNCVLRKKQCPS
ncbi:protein FAR1-RELATED SEQUENCE 5-like [Ipomoea triloba]|uniref:protein FAR1-RELATED SEQUENCE 5-like n=1 Tax=Ipomoea triloba TaxID=35885 RepID=UPI00125E340D|nr:protein FAR1-RELATED SEQUENCE 5-like [Ipomoea triloba]